MQIKAAGGRDLSFLPGNEEGELIMPAETAFVIAGIVLVFAVFAVTLAWADYYTRNYRAPGALK